SPYPTLFRSALGGGGPLLGLGEPHDLAQGEGHLSAAPLELVERVPLGPEGFAGLAAHGGVGFGDGGEPQDGPLVVGFAGEEPGEVVLVPAGHDQGAGAAGFDAGGLGAGPPLLEPLSLEGAHGVGVGLDGVVNDEQVGAAADG